MMAQLKGAQRKGTRRSKQPTATKATPERIVAVERQALAIELRKAGHTYEGIAKQLGYADRASAYNAVMAGLRLIVREPAEQLIALELARLDTIMVQVYNDARKGVVGAVDRVLRIMERRARLLGLDKPLLIDVDWRTELERQGVPASETFEKLVELIMVQQAQRKQ